MLTHHHIHIHVTVFIDTNNNYNLPVTLKEYPSLSARSFLRSLKIRWKVF